MSEFVVTTEHRTTTFHRDHEPALEIDPGDVVTYETGDVAYERLHGGESVEEIGLETFNLVTGPVAVRDAEPGDALVVDVLDVEIERAWSVWLPGFGGLGERTGEVQTREIEIEGDALRISDALTVPLEAMIGCIGVAPAEGEGSTFQPSYPFGGNMDLREMSPGTTLHLPVEVDGGRLSVGTCTLRWGERSRRGSRLRQLGEHGCAWVWRRALHRRRRAFGWAPPRSASAWATRWRKRTSPR